MGGSKASVINGTLSSAGNLYVVNPNGITLGINGSLVGMNIHLATARLTDDDISAFASTGILDTTGKGMGRVSLLGKVSADNLTIDAGQVIIRNINKIESFSGAYPDTRLSVTSSVKRIDVGGSSGTDLASFGLDTASGLVDHTGEYAVSTAAEFLDIAKAPDKAYFLTNDIDLGIIDETADAGLGFSGKLDGAFNNVTYSLNIGHDRGQDIGLFSSLKDATISNLGLKATINVSGSASGNNVGALAGTIKGGHYSSIDAYGADIYVSGSNLKLGSIAGNVESGSTVSSFSKVTGSLSSKSERLVQKNNSLTAGSLFGYANNLTADDYVSGYSDIIKSLGAGSAQIADNLTPADGKGYLLTEDNTYRLSGFYDPLFIKDFTFDYDGSIRNYHDLMSTAAFNLNDYASIENDYTGAAQEGGVYSHTLKSASEERGFYFVDEKGNTAATGKGTITIIAPEPEVVPEPETKPEPEVTPEPEPSKESEVTPEPAPEPEPSKESEATPEPEIAPEPEVTPEPEPSKESEVTPEPEISPEPEVTPEPEPSKESEVTPEPAPEPEVTPEPEPSKESEVTPEPAPETEDDSQKESTSDKETKPADSSKNYIPAYVQVSSAESKVPSYELAGHSKQNYFSAGDGRNLQSPFAKVARCGFCQGRSQLKLPLKSARLFKLPDQQPGTIALYNAINSTEKVLSEYAAFKPSGRSLALSTKEEEDSKKSRNRS